MTSINLKLAIISDLHCHPQRKSSKENNTFLFSDQLRSPIEDHPVESLLQVIAEDNLSADLLLCPGDFGDQCDKQGFLSGWNYVNEVARALNVKDVIATVGNHDIDSRHNYSSYSFDIPQKIRQNFPLKDKFIGNFWGQGFTFVEENDFQILVVNSTHFHTHYADPKVQTDNPAIKGKVDSTQLEAIEKYLAQNKFPSKIKILLCHHHPAKHSRSQLGEHDFIENGEDLLKILGEASFDFVVHGHKHDPWLRNYITNGGDLLPILSAGSFSATNQVLWNSKWNFFHLVELEKAKSSAAVGKVSTWTFKPKNGWGRNGNDGFFPYAGFGYSKDLQLIVEKIKTLFGQKQMLKWPDILNQIPEIENLIPDQITELEEKLKSESFILNAGIGLNPQFIYNNANIR